MNNNRCLICKNEFATNTRLIVLLVNCPTKAWSICSALRSSARQKNFLLLPIGPKKLLDCETLTSGFHVVSKHSIGKCKKKNEFEMEGMKKPILLICINWNRKKKLLTLFYSLFSLFMKWKSSSILEQWLYLRIFVSWICRRTHSTSQQWYCHHSTFWKCTESIGKHYYLKEYFKNLI